MVSNLLRASSQGLEILVKVSILKKSNLEDFVKGSNFDRKIIFAKTSILTEKVILTETLILIEK